MLSQNKDTSNLTISIAMCTFNGSDYLQEQLVSIAKQTHLPDELVVCDDGSTDSTLQILDEFKKKVLFPVIIHCNKKRLGATKNFEKVITLCKGEIIALCDQDDVWLPQKLGKIEELFREHPNAGYIFSNAIVVDEKLNSIDGTLWDYVSFTANRRRKFEQGNQIEVLVERSVVTGATMALCKTKTNWILPIPEEWVHDKWIALLASAAEEKGIFIEEPLIKYRLHSKQSIGINIDGDKKLNLIEQLKRAYNTKLESYEIVIDRLEYILNRLNEVNKMTKRTNEFLIGKIKHLHERQWMHNYSRWKRINRIFKELINRRYHRFSNGWEGVLKDLFL
jgi:glycosyltransferase involved in cell wall biosynthesis